MTIFCPYRADTAQPKCVGPHLLANRFETFFAAAATATLFVSISDGRSVLGFTNLLNMQFKRFFHPQINSSYAIGVVIDVYFRCD